MDPNNPENPESLSETAQFEPLEVVHPDDDDERLYLELVERWGMVETAGCDGMPTQFDDTDEEENVENINMGVDENEEDEGRIPVIEYDRDNPSIKEGSIFPSMTDFRNALATYCIKGEFDFVIDKSEPSRLTVHYAYQRCKWRMHTSPMRNSTVIQVNVNPFPHTCPSAERKETQKVAKSRWCASAVLEWVTKDPCIGPMALIKKIHEKYSIVVPYMMVYYGKEMALDRIYGLWKDSFNLLYTFKAKVEKTCQGSVVEIDNHTV
jgi:hypothetical protein